MVKKIEENTIPNKGQMILYQSSDGKATLDVRLEGETLWLNLNQMTGLFERDKSVISRHLRNIFKSGELDRNSVVAFFAHTVDPFELTGQFATFSCCHFSEMRAPGM